jgi:hypothetical protein
MYAYVGNDPINYTDPTGQVALPGIVVTAPKVIPFGVKAIGGLLGAIGGLLGLGGGISAAQQLALAKSAVRTEQAGRSLNVSGSEIFVTATRPEAFSAWNALPLLAQATPMLAQSSVTATSTAECAHKNATGQCVFRKGKNGKLEIDPEYAKIACKNAKAIRKSAREVGTYVVAPGAASGTSASILNGMYKWGLNVWTTGVVTLPASLTTLLLGNAKGPPGCKL